MNKLNCDINKNSLVLDGLSTYIDISNPLSWDLNPEFKVKSLYRWKQAVSSKTTLQDFGLTMFDYGLCSSMEETKDLTVLDDSYLTLDRVGYNIVNNNTDFDSVLSGDTVGGYSGETYYDIYSISGMTSELSGNFFNLDGGYLTGNFKYDDYGYYILPSRYNNGITIENMLYLFPQSEGIFYYMGVRNQDKYNPYFDGETVFDDTENEFIGDVFTSENEYLHSKQLDIVNNQAFRDYDDMKTTEFSDVDSLDNIKGNAIAFGLKINAADNTSKYIYYKYVNDNGDIVYNESDYSFNLSGSTLITITFRPDSVIEDPDLLYCTKRRTGKLFVYLNGRIFWIVPNMEEFYFTNINNHKTKQVGVPYTINWGGGSFGLKHSYHYDKNFYNVFSGEQINGNFILE